MKGNKKVFLAALLSTMALSGVYALSFALRAAPSTEIPIPWRSAVVGFFGFFVLFFLIKHRHLIQREKTCFSSVLQDNGIGAAVVEGITQILLAGVFLLLFGLMGILGESLYLTVFFGIASLVLTAEILTTEMPQILHKTIQILGYTVLIIYSMYVLTMHGYTGWRSEVREVVAPFANKALRWIWAAGLILVIGEFWKKDKRALLICLYGVVLYLVYQNTGRSPLLVFSILVLLSNLWENPRTTAKVLLGFLVAYVGFLVAALAAGWVEYRTFYFDYAGWVPAYGMGHSNLPALVLVSILFLSWYLWLKNHPCITILVCWTAAAGIWFMTYCRTVVVILAAFPLLNLYRVCLFKRKKTKGLSLLCWFPAGIAAVSVIGMFWIPTQTLFSIQGNFFMRFTNPYDAAQASGIHWFGTVFDPNPIIDNIFLHMLVFYGPISLALITCLLTWVGYRYYQNGQYAELVILAIFMLYSFMENAFIHMPFGFAALLMGPKPVKPGDCGMMAEKEEQMEQRR